jgi:hypothetical protein
MKRKWDFSSNITLLGVSRSRSCAGEEEIEGTGGINYEQ